MYLSYCRVNQRLDQSIFTCLMWNPVLQKGNHTTENVYLYKQIYHNHMKNTSVGFYTSVFSKWPFGCNSLFLPKSAQFCNLLQTVVFTNVCFIFVFKLIKRILFLIFKNVLFCNTVYKNIQTSAHHISFKTLSDK